MTEFENNNFEENGETMEDALNAVHDVKVGDIVKGEVLALEDRQAIIGIEGTGVEGVVPAKELSTLPVEDINEVVKVGDVLDLVVISSIGKDKEMVVIYFPNVVLMRKRFGKKLKKNTKTVKRLKPQ